MPSDHNIKGSESDGSEVSAHPTPETNRVRQGVTGHNVRYVLGFSLLAVVVAMAVVGIYGAGL